MSVALWCDIKLSYCPSTVANLGPQIEYCTALYCWFTVPSSSFSLPVDVPMQNLWVFYSLLGRQQVFTAAVYIDIALCTSACHRYLPRPEGQIVYLACLRHMIGMVIVRPLAPFFPYCGLKRHGVRSRLVMGVDPGHIDMQLLAHSQEPSGPNRQLHASLKCFKVRQ